ncbi:ribosome recycling factor, partial [Blyttiomyces helicus]
KGSAKKAAEENEDEDEDEDDEDEDEGVKRFELDTGKMEAWMRGAVDRYKKEVGAVRLGRASPGLLEPVMVTHKGSRVPLSKIAQVSVKDAQTLLVIVNEDELVSAVDTAIRSADLNLNPQKDDRNVLRVPIPKLSPEYKETLIKSVAQSAEKSRTVIRKIRADMRTHIKKAPKGSMSVDEERRYEKTVQTATDKYVGEVDAALATKTKEI